MNMIHCDRCDTKAPGTVTPKGWTQTTRTIDIPNGFQIQTRHLCPGCSDLLSTFFNGLQPARGFVDTGIRWATMPICLHVQSNTDSYTNYQIDRFKTRLGEYLTKGQEEE